MLRGNISTLRPPFHGINKIIRLYHAFLFQINNFLVVNNRLLTIREAFK